MRYSPRASVLLLVLAGAACALGACTSQPGMIDSDAIADPVERVVERHNSLVNQSTTLTDLQKSTYTRTADLLRDVVREAQKARDTAPAKKITEPNAAQPDGNNSTRTLAPPDTKVHLVG